MSQRTIATILALKDQASKPLVRVASKTKDLEKRTKQANNAMIRFGKNSMKSMDKVVVASAKVVTGMAAVASSFAIKTGFGEAMNMEGFRTQLETATKSAKKAGEIMKWSVDLANKTPFETGSIVEMSSKYEAMGMSSKKWGSITADMAGATNKDVIEATEAIIDAQTGELERLKEFGITKAMIAKKSGEMFRGQEVVNAKGQIVDQEKFNQALMQMMEEKYKGGAASLAKTTKGMWSTVTGVAKTSLANIVGMQNDGTIKQGSMLDMLKKKIQKVADTLTKWQSDGTIQKIASNVTTTVKKVIKVISVVFNFIKAHKTMISNILVVIGSFIIAVKIGMAIAKVIRVVQIAMLLLNGTLILSPFGWLVIIIGTVIAVGVLLYKNWHKITKAVSGAWTWFKTLIDGLPNFALLLAGPLAPLLLLIKNFSKVKDAIKGAWKWFKKFNEEKVSEGEANGKSNSVTLKGYAKGGIARSASIFGEAGAEMAIPLNRSQRSKKLLSQADSIINGGGSSNGMTIQIVIDTFIGEDGFVDTIGEKIYKKVRMAMSNMA